MNLNNSSDFYKTETCNSQKVISNSQKHKKRIYRTQNMSVQRKGGLYETLSISRIVIGHHRGMLYGVCYMPEKWEYWGSFS